MHNSFIRFASGVKNWVKTSFSCPWMIKKKTFKLVITIKCNELWEFQYQVLCNNLAISCLHFKGFSLSFYDEGLERKSTTWLWACLPFNAQKDSFFSFFHNVLWCFGNGIFLESFFSLRAQCQDYRKQMRKNVCVYVCAYKRSDALQTSCYVNVVTIICCPKKGSLSLAACWRWGFLIVWLTLLRIFPPKRTCVSDFTVLRTFPPFTALDLTCVYLDLFRHMIAAAKNVSLKCIIDMQ